MQASSSDSPDSKRPRKKQPKAAEPEISQARVLTSGSSESDDSTAQNRVGPPVLQLSQRWLTISLLAVALIPVTLAATVWYAIPTNPEPGLPVELALEPVAWPPGASADVRLMPGIRIHNPTDARWRNVSMGINKQFYFYCPEPLDGGGSLSVPLAFFRTSGNQAYRPTSVPLKKVTVYAQLPSGRRAIYEATYAEAHK